MTCRYDNNIPSSVLRTMFILEARQFPMGLRSTRVPQPVSSNEQAQETQA